MVVVLGRFSTWGYHSVWCPHSWPRHNISDISVSPRSFPELCKEFNSLLTQFLDTLGCPPSSPPRKAQPKVAWNCARSLPAWCHVGPYFLSPYKKILQLINELLACSTTWIICTGCRKKIEFTLSLQFVITAPEISGRVHIPRSRRTSKSESYQTKSHWACAPSIS